jgi:15-cis-phytoene synthase
VRPALEALWRLDAALGAVLATGRDPMVSRIRLAWWRESLERLDAESPPPEPLLQALAVDVLPRSVSGSELAAMEEGWAELLADGPLGAAALDRYAAARGGRLFGLSARLLGGGEASATEAGARWALVDLARRSSRSAEARAALELARRAGARQALRGKLRPLGMLDCLTQRDIGRGPDAWERQGSPARVMRMVCFRLSGR